MTGPITTPRLFQFYQYDPTAASILKIPDRPKVISISETEISIHNPNLFERPVLYIEKSQKMGLPAYVQSNRQFMDYLNACSLSIPNEKLPPNLTPTSKIIHTYKIKQALPLFFKLANEGFAPAAHYLGLCFLTGTNIVQNTENAIRFIQIAASSGFTPAQVTLGYIYEQGIGLPVNFRIALSLYEASAKEGNAVGFFLLATCYEYGNGVPTNPRQASIFYQEAFKLGLLAARYALNRIYFKIVNAAPTLTTSIGPILETKKPETPFLPVLVPPTPQPILLPQKRAAPASYGKASSSKRIATGETIDPCFI